MVTVLVITAVTLVVLTTIVLPRVFANFYAEPNTPQTAADTPPVPLDAPLASLGFSEVRPAPAATTASIALRPEMRTLRVEATPNEPAAWRLRIRFVFINRTPHEICFDDIHARIYERDVPTPAFATIHYRGEVLLRQDNTIFKDERAWTLASGDGFEITLAFDLTRYEGLATMGETVARPGPVRTLFGLLLDYFGTAQPFRREAIASDCLYLFQHGDGETRFTALDAAEVEAMRSRHASDARMLPVVETCSRFLREHHALRPVPRA
jgi:hypothetical protein